MAVSRLALWLLLSWALSSGRAVAGEQADAELMLRSEHAWVRALAAKRLGRETGMRAEAALARALDDPAPFVRHLAAVAFARWKKPSPQVTSILTASLQSKDWYVRWQACLGLKRLGENAKAAVPRLIHALCDTELDVCREAALALGSIAPKEERVVVGLAKTLNADHPVDASAVLYSLKQAGEAARPAVPWLVEASRDYAGAYVLLIAVASESQEVLVDFASPDRIRRYYAVRSLGKLKGREGVRYVLLALDDEDHTVRRRAVRVLGEMGKRATVALPRIVRALRSPDESTRSEARIALAKLAPRLEDRVVTIKSDVIPDEITLNLEPGPWQAELQKLVADERIGEAILNALAEVSDKSKEEIVAAMTATAPREEK